MKTFEFMRRLGQTFFPAFSLGIGFCFVQMVVSARPILSAGLMLLCIGMALLCANVQVWAEEKLKERKDENGEQHQSNSEESRAEVRHTDTHCA